MINIQIIFLTVGVKHTELTLVASIKPIPNYNYQAVVISNYG